MTNNLTQAATSGDEGFHFGKSGSVHVHSGTRSLQIKQKDLFDFYNKIMTNANVFRKEMIALAMFIFVTKRVELDST